MTTLQSPIALAQCSPAVVIVYVVLHVLNTIGLSFSPSGIVGQRT